MMILNFNTVIALIALCGFTYSNAVGDDLVQKMCDEIIQKQREAEKKSIYPVIEKAFADAKVFGFKNYEKLHISSLDVKTFDRVICEYLAYCAYTRKTNMHLIFRFCKSNEEFEIDINKLANALISEQKIKHWSFENSAVDCNNQEYCYSEDDLKIIANNFKSIESPSFDFLQYSESDYIAKWNSYEAINKIKFNSWGDNAFNAINAANDCFIERHVNIFIEFYNDKNNDTKYFDWDNCADFEASISVLCNYDGPNSNVKKLVQSKQLFLNENYAPDFLEESILLGKLLQRKIINFNKFIKSFVFSKGMVDGPGKLFAFQESLLNYTRGKYDFDYRSIDNYDDENAQKILQIFKAVVDNKLFFQIRILEYYLNSPLSDYPFLHMISDQPMPQPMQQPMPNAAPAPMQQPMPNAVPAPMPQPVHNSKRVFAAIFVKTPTFGGYFSIFAQGLIGMDQGLSAGIKYETHSIFICAGGVVFKDGRTAPCLQVGYVWRCIMLGAGYHNHAFAFIGIDCMGLLS